MRNTVKNQVREFLMKLHPQLTLSEFEKIYRQAYRVATIDTNFVDFNRIMTGIGEVRPDLY